MSIINATKGQFITDPTHLAALNAMVDQFNENIRSAVKAFGVNPFGMDNPEKVKLQAIATVYDPNWLANFHRNGVDAIDNTEIKTTSRTTTKRESLLAYSSFTFHLAQVKDDHAAGKFNPRYMFATKHDFRMVKVYDLTTQALRDDVVAALNHSVASYLDEHGEVKKRDTVTIDERAILNSLSLHGLLHAYKVNPTTREIVRIHDWQERALPPEGWTYVISDRELMSKE